MFTIFFQNYSIRTKLISFFSLSAGIALFLATTSSFIYNIFEYKNKEIKESIKLAKVSGKNISASLMFDDKESAKKMLAPILNDQNISTVNIYNSDGLLFTALGDSDLSLNTWDEAKFLTYPDTNIVITFDYIDILISIRLEEEKIGFLQIISDTKAIKNRVIQQSMVSIVIVLFTLLFIFFLAFWFEKIFSRPLYDLLHAIKHIKNYTDFDIHLISHTKDEFNDLYTEFNRMTNEIKKRDLILKEHNISLKIQVDSTNEELIKTQNSLNEVSILATTDPLTSLSNRRNTLDKFNLLIKQAQENNIPLGIILLDIDYFKKVNDTIGHQAGDTVLQEVANLLLKNARDNDIVGRIGGEEFLILCQNANIETTYKVAERTRHSVEKQVIYYDKSKTKKIQVTISIGLYSTIPTNITKEELIKITDEALYKAKETGRNRVVKGKSK